MKASTLSALQLPRKTPPFILTSSKAYVRSYTFIPSVYYGICHLVAFFHLLLDSPFRVPRNFVSCLFGTGHPCIIVPQIETYQYRGKQHWLLRYPTFWLVLAQIVTLGIMSTIYWPLLLISRVQSSEAEEDNRRTKSGAKSSRKTDLGRGQMAKLIEPVQVRLQLYYIVYPIYTVHTVCI